MGIVGVYTAEPHDHPGESAMIAGDEKGQDDGGKDEVRGGSGA